MKRAKISVVLATYNGGEFLHDQLDSILKQLDSEDEIVISDDGSTDNTLEIVESYDDDRIKIISGPKKGVKQNFANAIYNCTGDYIYLADQDDIWLDNKIDAIQRIFEQTRCMLVVHDCEVFNSKTNKIIYESFFGHRKSGSGYFKNLWKNTYIGCCMAFDSRLKEKVLPIPDDIKMHDQWIGLIAEKNGKVVFLPEVLLRYRRHGNNATNMHRGKLSNIIGERMRLMKRLKERYG